MARKKQEVALQLEIETQEEWEELLTKEGLIVIDVYQEWAGPCKSMIQYFKRLRNELPNSENLHFAVVYQEWAGKSAAFLNVLKDCLVKVSHDKMLKLAAAKADTVDCLERYRGKCQPCYLFYAGGCLVSVVRGANAPLLSKTVTNELAKEHKVLKGDAERVEVKDPMFAHLESEKSVTDESESEKTDENKPKKEDPAPEINRQHDRSPVAGPSITPSKSVEGSRHTTKSAEMVQKEVTVALLKPDIVRDGKVDEVLEKMKEAGIEVLKHEERQLTEEEARDFYGHLKDESFFDELVEFMCSGPSHVLLLSKADDGKGIVEEWRELIGPKSVEDAKANAPNSLRSQYGTKEMINALHGSDSHQAAIRELAFFFPEYQVPKVAARGRHMAHTDISGVQRTLALIRPDALAEKRDEILKRISEAGFTIALQKEIQLTQEQAENFYSEHKDQPYYDDLMTKMTSGPVLALGLARKDAVGEWRKLLGPTTVSEAKETAPESLRAQFSVDGTEINMLHGSESTETANKEIEFFFPVQKTVAVIKPDAYENKDSIIEKIKEAGFHVAARKETTLTKEIAEMLYQQNKDAEFYGDLIDHMTSGPTLFMVLTKVDAVENWRGAIGPTDPEKAKAEAPHSLRAAFGTDVKANALHGASTEDSAKQVITEVFGDIKFQDDGKVVDSDASQLHEGVEVEKAVSPAAAQDATAAEEDTTEKQGDMSEAAPEDESAAKTEQTPADGSPEQEEAPAELAQADQEQPPAAVEDQPAAADDQPAATEDQPAVEPALTPSSEELKVTPGESALAAEGESKTLADTEQIPGAAEQTPAADAGLTKASEAEKTPAYTEKSFVPSEAPAVQAPPEGKDRTSDRTLTPHDQTNLADKSGAGKVLTTTRLGSVSYPDKMAKTPSPGDDSQKSTGSIKSFSGDKSRIKSDHPSSMIQPVKSLSPSRSSRLQVSPSKSAVKSEPGITSNSKPNSKMKFAEGTKKDTSAGLAETEISSKPQPSTASPHAADGLSSSANASDPTNVNGDDNSELAAVVEQKSRPKGQPDSHEEREEPKSPPTSHSSSHVENEARSNASTPEMRNTAKYMPTSSRAGSVTSFEHLDDAENEDDRARSGAETPISIARAPSVLLAGSEAELTHSGTDSPSSIVRAPSVTLGESHNHYAGGSPIIIKRSDSVSFDTSDQGEEDDDGDNQSHASSSQYSEQFSEEEDATTPTVKAEGEEKPEASGEDKPADAAVAEEPAEKPNEETLAEESAADQPSAAE